MSDLRHPEVDDGNVIDFLAARRRRLSAAGRQDELPASLLPAAPPYPGTSDNPEVHAAWAIACAIWDIR